MSTTGGSLNAGAELDDEPQLKNDDLFEGPIEPGEIPELKDDVNILAVMESRLVDLSYLAEDIARANGMSKDFAMEAERILPNVLSSPQGFFTKAPSATQYRVSMEEIHKGVWALIAAAAVAVIGVIWKIVSWLGGGKSDDKSSSGGGSSSGSGSSNKAKQTADKMATEVANTETVADAVVDAEGTMHRINSEMSTINIVINDKNGRPVSYSNMDKIIETLLTDGAKYEQAKRFLESRDPLFHDIINSGQFSKQAFAAAMALRDLQGALNSKIDEVDNILKSDMGNDTRAGELKHNKALENDRLAKPIEIKFDGSMMTIEDVATTLSDTRHSVMDKDVQGRIHFDQLFSKIASAYKGKKTAQMLTEIKNVTATVIELEDRLEEMKKLAGNLSNDGAPGANTTGVAVRIRSAIMVLGKDVIGYGMLVQQLKWFILHHDYLAVEAIGFGTEVVRKITHEMKANNQEVPKEWRNLMEELQGTNKGIRKAFYGS